MSELPISSAAPQLEANVVINRLRPRILLAARVPEHQLAPLPVFSHHVSGGDPQHAAPFPAPLDELARRRQKWTLLATRHAHKATGLEVRVRPDLEIELDGVRIGADLKTISMWNVKQESLRARLHREIIDRDYHLSAAMYCETAALDQFFWIFVNKDENYHWIGIIEASTELLELGMLEYRKTMRAIATGFDTGEWPAPITTDYTDELNDFDLRRLEALRAQA